MGRVPWKENKVISIETREKVFVLAQMLKFPYLMVYNAFRETNEWDDIDLKQVETLLCHGATRQFISRSNVTRQDIPPVNHQDLPKRWIDTHPGSEVRTVWEGTPKERRVVIIGKGGGALIERDITKGGDQNLRVIMRSIPLDDHATIDNHELTNLFIHPSSNERIYLCYLFGRNVDPLRDLVFRRPIPEEYERYLDLISPRP